MSGNKRIQYKNSLISYSRMGNGSMPVLCFHGYGENAVSFSLMEWVAGKDFSFIATDLPFHGNTVWNEGLVFTDEDLTNIITQILEEERFSLVQNDCKVILMGFSLGGRVSLSLLKALPDKIDRLVLLAPDGLKVNFWYWLTTQTFLGNKLFHFTMKHPGWFFGFLKILNRLKLVNASVFKFVNYYIANPDMRMLLYKRWTSLRKLKPNLSMVKKRINRYGVPVRLLYGKYDRIMLPVVGERFKKGLNDCKICILECGHQILRDKNMDDILSSLRD